MFCVNEVIDRLVEKALLLSNIPADLEKKVDFEKLNNNTTQALLVVVELMSTGYNKTEIEFILKWDFTPFAINEAIRYAGVPDEEFDLEQFYALNNDLAQAVEAVENLFDEDHSATEIKLLLKHKFELGTLEQAIKKVGVPENLNSDDYFFLRQIGNDKLICSPCN
jgi:hypothetical protein